MQERGENGGGGAREGFKAACTDRKWRGPCSKEERNKDWNKQKTENNMRPGKTIYSKTGTRRAWVAELTDSQSLTHVSLGIRVSTWYVCVCVSRIQFLFPIVLVWFGSWYLSLPPPFGRWTDSACLVLRCCDCCCCCCWRRHGLTRLSPLPWEIETLDRRPR